MSQNPPVAIGPIQATPISEPAGALESRDPAVLQREILGQEGRDYELWSIVILASLVVSAGFASLLLPNLVWGAGVVRLEIRFLPQLIFGLVALIVLFNIYVISQRRKIRRVRTELLRQLARTDEVIAKSFIDPLTRVFNRRYMDYLLPHEAKRADRSGAVFSILVVDLDEFRAINNRFGHAEGDRFLQQVAEVLKRTFRQSDTIIRHGGDEFLVVMPETSEDDAQFAINRLSSEVAAWNLAHKSTGYSMSLSCGVASYAAGAEIDRVVELADQRMYRQKTHHTVV